MTKLSNLLVAAVVAVALTQSIIRAAAQFNVGPPPKLSAEEQKALDLQIKNNGLAEILLFDQKCENRIILKTNIARIQAQWDALDETTKKTIWSKQETFFNERGANYWCRLMIDLVVKERLYKDLLK